MVSATQRTKSKGCTGQNPNVKRYMQLYGHSNTIHKSQDTEAA